MAAMCVAAAQGLYAGEQADFRAFYAVPGVAFYGMPGDRALRSGCGGSLVLGYDINEPFAVEASAGYASLEGRGGHGRAAFVPVALDGLYHFTRWERFDPVLFAGLGLDCCDRPVFDGRKTAFSVRAGGGFFYHLSEAVSARGSVAVYRPGYKATLPVTVSAGIAVYF